MCQKVIVHGENPVFANPNQAWVFGPDKPWCLCLSDFAGTSTKLGVIFAKDTQPEIDTVVNGNVVPGIPIAEKYEFTKQNLYSNGVINPRFDQWAMAQDDTLKKTHFLPIRGDYEMDFVIPKEEIQDMDTWVRIDFVRPGKILPNTSQHEFNLPNSLPGFNGLAKDSMLERNSYNPLYHKRFMKTKWLKFPRQVPKYMQYEDSLVASQVSTTQPGHHTNESRYMATTRKLKFSFKPPKKVVHLNVENNAFQDFRTNIPIKDRCWMIVSVNRQIDIDCTIKRVLHFRDGAGQAA